MLFINIRTAEKRIDQSQICQPKRGNMTIEYDEKGKIFTDIVSKIAIFATIQTTTHLLRGRIHVRRDQRVIDELDLNENFLPINEVSVMGPNG